MYAKLSTLIFSIALIVGGLFFYSQKDNLLKSNNLTTYPNNQTPLLTSVLLPTSTLTPTKIPTLTPTPTLQTSSKVLLTVPFAPQAPLGEWKDSRFQDGCEEASAIMAMAWVNNEVLTKDIVRQKIIDLAAFQQENYSEARDTSAEDTIKRIFNDYYKYQNVELKEDITLEDIKDVLRQGNLVIIPANGQVLDNPNFTPPGPERHNLVVKGYDDTKGIFITNDPGTRQGEHYSYPQNILFNAIRDYPTGYHVPIAEVKKVMIVVKK